MLNKLLRTFARLDLADDILDKDICITTYDNTVLMQNYSPRPQLIEVTAHGDNGVVFRIMVQPGQYYNMDVVTENLTYTSRRV